MCVMRWSPLLSLMFLLFFLNLATAARDAFHEELVLRPLAQNKFVSAHFRFTTLTANPTAASSSHLDLAPRHVHELVTKLGLVELSTSLTRGVWRHNKWGEAQEAPAPPGASLEAIFDSDERVDERWRELTQALAGQWCASINFLDSKLAVSSKWSHPTMGYVANDNNRTMVKMSGVLSSEIVCTENLTPWKKLLPCEAKRGLATLLNARETQKSVYHSLGLTVRRVCSNKKGTSANNECTSPSLEIVQSASFVFDLRLLSDKATKNWSLRRLFGLGLHSKCPLAQTSNLYFVEKPTSDISPKMKLSTEATRNVIIPGWYVQVLEVGELVSRREANIQVETNSTSLASSSSTLRVSKHQIGFGQERGAFITRITNPLSTPLNVSYMDVYPWFLRIYLSTLKISYRKDAKNKMSLSPRKTSFVPGIDRSRPYVLECLLELPATSETEIRIDFEKSLLKWSEYPPDANHGFTVSSAVVNALIPKSTLPNIAITRQLSTFNEFFLNQENDDMEEEWLIWRLYSEPVLIYLPTPDFSMPYNVICLTCTVVAMAFGPLHNLTTRDLRIVPKDDDKAEGTFLGRMKNKILGKFGWKRASKEENAKVKENEETKSADDTEKQKETKKEK